MKGAALILFCAFALALSDDIELNANGCPVDFEVHKVITHDAYCNLFYSCDNGLRVELRCPGVLVFNAVEGVCDWPHFVDCGGKGISESMPESEEDEEEINSGVNKDPSLAWEICSKVGSDGVKIAHEYCNNYYVCEGNVPNTLPCPYGLVYNYYLGVCDWPNNFECGNRPILEPSPDTTEVIRTKSKPRFEIGEDQPLSVYETCAKDDTSELLLAHETCNRFYKCSYGLPVAFSCPAGLLYNIKKQYCDWQQNVECGDRDIVEDEVVDGNNNDSDGNEDNDDGDHGHSDPSLAPAICAAEDSDGILVAHENCDQFYKCWNGIPVSLDCPPNLLYNSKLEICDWPQNVDCGTRIKSSRKH